MNSKQTTRKGNPTTPPADGRATVAPARSLWDIDAEIGQPPAERRRASRLTRHTVQDHYPALLVFTYLSRYVTRDQLMRRFPDVFKSPRTANYQLKAMRTLDLLKRVESHYSATFPYCYIITRKGTRLMNETFGFDLPHAREDARTPQNLMHELLLTDIQLAISLTAKVRPDLSIRFFERRYHVKGKQLLYSAYGDRQALEPDLGFLLAIERNGQRHLLQHFVEFDRGTESPKVFRRKLEQYDAWFQSDGRDYLCDLYRRHGANDPKPHYRLLVVSRRRKGTSDTDRLATLFTQSLNLPDATKNRIFFTSGDVLKNYEQDDQPLAAELWWQVRFARPWLPAFATIANEVGDAANKRPVYNFVADQLALMPRHTLFPPMM